MGVLSELGGSPIDVDAASPDAATVAGPTVTPRVQMHEGPRQIGRYMVLRTLGAGGMGVVYAAYDPQLDRTVALKRLREGTAQADPRMLREALAMARLAHPNVVAVHEVDVDAHGVYIVMEFVHGVSLRSWLAAAPRTTDEILAAFVQAGHGLAAAHAAGLVHRDFKPDNVLVDREGRVRVCDFGLARAPGGDEFVDTDQVAAFTDRTRSSDILATPVTGDGTVVGTPGYMAPEQAAGVHADVHADIFSFCLSLYEALHGHRPPTAGAPRDPRPPDTSRKVPAWLRSVIDRGLRADPRARWPSVHTLLRALTSDPLAARRRGLRTATFVALGAALTVACVLGGTHVARTWAHAQAEARAAARLAVVDAAAHTPEGAAAFAAFVADEDHRGTAGLTLAYLHRGERSAARGDLAAALDDYATAYTRASTPMQAETALRAVARGFRRTWSARQLGQTLAVLASTTADDAELAALRVDHALLAGDVVGAAEALTHPLAADSPLQPLQPVLAALSYGGPTGAIGRQPRLGEYAGSPAISTVWNNRLDVFAAAPTLPRLASFTAPVALDLNLARTGWALAVEAGQLHVLDLTRPDPIRLRVPFAGEAYHAEEADLDRDGSIDLYLGPGSGHRGFYVIHDIYGDPRPPAPAHAATHQAGPDLEAVRLVDLDGDGERELLAGFGAWTAYDVRAFRGAATGLDLVARATLGRPAGIAEIRLADGATRLAIAADESYASPALFPAPPHVAAPAGIHLLRRDLSLAEETALQIPRRPDGAAFHLSDGLLVGDLDGDGREDMLLGATGITSRADQPVTFLYAQRPSGEFAAAALVGLLPRLLVDLDDDPAPELVAIDRDNQLWVLGTGDAPLPRPRALPPPRVPVPAELADSPLADRWLRAQELANLGLAAAAARDLEDAARLAPEPARLRLLDRAGELAVLAGDDAHAVALGEPLLASQDHRAAALARSSEALVRLGRFAEASRLVEALARAPQPLHNGPAATLRALADLAELARADLQLRLDFDHPLTGWRIDRPEAVRRDPARDALALELVGDDTRVLSTPLLWTGGPLSIEFELELGDLEWGQELRVSLVDDEGRTWLGGGSGGGGGGGSVVQTLSGVGLGLLWSRIHELPRPPANTSRRLHVRLGVLPRTRQGFFVFECDGRVISDPFELTASPTPGRYHLVLGTAATGNPPLRLAGRVRGLTVHGALIDPQPLVVTPQTEAAARLADGDPAGALAALAGEPKSSPEASLLAAFALAELGDLDGARAAFTDALASDDPDLVARVHRALRRGPAAALAARAALGPEFLIAAHATWAPYIHQHAAIPEALPRAREALAGLERVTPRTPAQRRALADLLTLRGVLAADDGDPQRATHDLVTGLRSGPADRIADDATLALVRLHADDPARALAYTQEALARSARPDAVRLRLRSDPALATLHNDPRWSALVADPVAP